MSAGADGKSVCEAGAGLPGSGGPVRAPPLSLEAGRRGGEDKEGSLCQTLGPLGSSRSCHGAGWPGLSPWWDRRRGPGSWVWSQTENWCTGGPEGRQKWSERLSVVAVSAAHPRPQTPALLSHLPASPPCPGDFFLSLFHFR